MKWFTTLAVLCLISIGATAQSTVEFDNAMTSEMEGADKIRKRFDDFHSRRFGNGAVIAPDHRAKAIDQVKRMERSKIAEYAMEAQPQWTQVGPRSTGGRIKDILIHPENTDIIYIAAAAGGVWKSEDAGLSWSPKMDDGNAIAMGSLCFDPTDPNIIYAGTGEQVTNANTYLGAGLFRSTDAGETWETVGLTTIGSISRVYAHPQNRDLIMVAAMNTNGGVYKSLDRGETWEKLYDGQIYDMTINPSDADEWFISARDDGVQYTSNGGNTWSRRMNGIFGTLGRLSIQQSPVNPDVLYVLAELNNLAQILKSEDRGLTFVTQYNDPNGCFFAGSCNPASSQAFYDNYVYCSPHDADVAFVGGIDIFRTTNGGQSWSNLTNGYSDGNGANPVHVDQHCAEIDPKNPSLVYAGNDGGMVKSEDLGGFFYVINNGLSVTQFYSFDNDPSRRGRMFGGTQDNGTLGSFDNVEWDTVAGGDGMVTIVDHGDPDVIFGNFPNGRPYRINLRTGGFRRAEQGINLGESALWVAPNGHEPDRQPGSLPWSPTRMAII